MPSTRRSDVCGGAFRGILSPAGLQFSLSESPEGDRVTAGASLGFNAGDIGEIGFPICCMTALLDMVLFNRGFLPGSDFHLIGGAFRFTPFGCRTPLVDLRRLMAATAEPLDSFSAWVVSSSRESESQHCSHTCASRDRPFRRLGGKSPVRAVMGGSVTFAAALWLRCSSRGLGRGDDETSGCVLGGELW